jgi:hypothetical protein
MDYGQIRIFYISALKTKRAKLKKLINLAKYEEDKRMGKVVERKKGRR